MPGTYGLIKDTTVFLDGQYYARTRFENCQMVYSGGMLPVLHDNQYSGCSWLLDGPANSTLDYMRMLIQMGGAEIVKAGLGLHDGQ